MSAEQILTSNSVFPNQYASTNYNPCLLFQYAFLVLLLRGLDLVNISKGRFYVFLIKVSFLYTFIGLLLLKSHTSRLLRLGIIKFLLLSSFLYQRAFCLDPTRKSLNSIVRDELNMGLKTMFVVQDTFFGSV